MRIALPGPKSPTAAAAPDPSVAILSPGPTAPDKALVVLADRCPNRAEQVFFAQAPISV